VGLPETHGTAGVRTIVAEQARWLAARGHRVRVVAAARAGLDEVEARDGYAVRAVGRPPRDGQPFEPAAWHAALGAAWPSILADGRPDVVHGHSESELGLVAAGLVGPGSGLPVVSTLAGSPVSGLVDHLRLVPAREGGLRRWPRTLRAAAAVLPTFGARRHYRRRWVIALSDRHAEMVRRSYAPRRLEVVYPGVDAARFRPPGTGEREAARRLLGLPVSGEVWAFVGRLGAGKGADLALAALARASREPWLLVAGDGPERAALEAFAARLGLGARVAFAGDLVPPTAAYWAADALLFPTRHEESFGLVLAEAMACGLPVVASDRGASAEVVGDAGLVVAGDDVAALAAAMARLGADADLRRRLGAAARRRAAGVLGSEATVARLEGIYEALVADPAER